MTMPVTQASIAPGSTDLPAGFAHPHASEESRAIAKAGMILRAQVGSGVHGTAIAGQDDRDEMGICLEPPQFVTGLAQVPCRNQDLARRLIILMPCWIVPWLRRCRGLALSPSEGELSWTRTWPGRGFGTASSRWKRQCARRWESRHRPSWSQS